MDGKRRVTVSLVLTDLLVGALAGSRAEPAGAAKLQKACTILKPAEIETVVGIPIAEPDGTGSKSGCSFDIGDGIAPGWGSTKPASRALFTTGFSAGWTPLG